MELNHQKFQIPSRNIGFASLTFNTESNDNAIFRYQKPIEKAFPTLLNDSKGFNILVTTKKERPDSPVDLVIIGSKTLKTQDNEYTMTQKCNLTKKGDSSSEELTDNTIIRGLAYVKDEIMQKFNELVK